MHDSVEGTWIMSCWGRPINRRIVCVRGIKLDVTAQLYHPGPIIERSSSQIRIELPVSRSQFFGNVVSSLLGTSVLSVLSCKPLLRCTFKVSNHQRTLVEKLLFSFILQHEIIFPSYRFHILVSP